MTILQNKRTSSFTINAHILCSIDCLFVCLFPIKNLYAERIASKRSMPVQRSRGHVLNGLALSYVAAKRDIHSLIPICSISVPCISIHVQIRS